MTSHSEWAGGSVAPLRNPTTRDQVKPHELTDEEACIAAWLTDEDERSLSQVFAAYRDVVHTVAFVIVRDHEDAEDVVNLTFASAWRQRARFDAARGPILAWLSVIARNRAFDVVRARKRRARHTTRYGIETHTTYSGPFYRSPDAQQRIEYNELCDVLRAALNGLPAAQRDVIELAYLGHCSHADVAARLGVPLGTVKTRARLALRRMRAALGTAPARA